MKNFILAVLLPIVLISCKQGKKLPDISGVKVELATIRFEKDFFAMDTLQISRSLDELNKKYPGFTADFLFNILGSSPALAPDDVKSFIGSYQSVYTNSQAIFGNFNEASAEIKKGFQYVHYYFPAYKLPKKIVTFIGPINSYGCIITTDAIAVGLQLFLGKDHPLYLSEQGQSLYPSFISRRFDKAYIPVNAIRNIIEDMFPEKNAGRPLVEQMVESGKRLYLLNQLLPELPDTLKTGYTKSQLDACFGNEKNIWSMFIQNELLYKSDPQLTRDFMNDAPSTQMLGEGSPGNIGQFTGWQIVKKWMKNNPTTTLNELMEKDPAALFSEAKYKPS